MSATPETSSLRPCPACQHSCSPSAKTCPNCGHVFPDQESEPAAIAGQKIYDYVFNHSLMMVGLCLTLLGLTRLMEGLKNISTLADELLAANAVFFLVAGLLSYFALKQTRPGRRKNLGQAADVVFSLGIVCLVAICCVIALSLV
jgi:hypothetical protein